MTRVFAEVATVVHNALLELGRDSVLVACRDLREGCASAAALGGRQAIVVGTNALALYMETDGSRSAAITRHMIPEDAILYNFEFISDDVLDIVADASSSALRIAQGGRHGHWLCAPFLHAHSTRPVWEYSWGNMQQWRKHGVAPTYVPLGAASNVFPLPQPRGGDGDGDGDIDVLFFGSNNPHRAGVERALVAAGLDVTWPGTPVFGPALHALIRRAKVVLVLASFQHPLEFKMTRLMVGFALRAFMVAESPQGSPVDVDPFARGYIRAPAADLPVVVARYVADAPARHAVAAAGHALYTTRRAAHLMQDAVEAAEQRRASK